MRSASKASVPESRMWRWVVRLLTVVLMASASASDVFPSPWVRVSCEIQVEEFGDNYSLEDSVWVVTEVSRLVVDSCASKFGFINWTFAGDTAFQDTSTYDLLLTLNTVQTSEGREIRLIWRATIGSATLELKGIVQPLLYGENDDWPSHEPDKLLSRARTVLLQQFKDEDFPFDLGRHYLSRVVLAKDIDLADTTTHLEQLVLPLDWNRLKIADSAVFRVEFRGIPPTGDSPADMVIDLSENDSISDSAIARQNVMSRITDFRCRDWEKDEDRSWFVELKKVLGNREEGTLAVYLLKFYPDDDWDKIGALLGVGPEGDQP